MRVMQGIERVGKDPSHSKRHDDQRSQWLTRPGQLDANGDQQHRADERRYAKQHAAIGIVLRCVTPDRAGLSIAKDRNEE